jgi:hypothetical protein
VASAVKEKFYLTEGKMEVNALILNAPPENASVQGDRRSPCREFTDELRLKCGIPKKNPQKQYFQEGGLHEDHPKSLQGEVLGSRFFSIHATRTEEFNRKLTISIVKRHSATAQQNDAY